MIDFNEFTQRADDCGVRLEIIGGLPVWEMLPNLRHQKAIDRIRQSFRVAYDQAEQPCECVHYPDLHVKFPDGSDKRPDISIFCHEPGETDFAVTDVPEAVIEILSRGYEKKDLELGPPFYLGQGVKDVLVFDPHGLTVRHFNASGARQYPSPYTFILACGCQVTV